jgi:hypothetical protein
MLITTLEKIDRACTVVQELCTGGRKWTMKIPADLNDPDIVISGALHAAHADIRALTAELSRLRAIEARMTEEGVAHALHESNPVPTDMVNEYWSWEGLPEELRALYFTDARAVIAYLKGE